ncbi:MAG: glycoside hydrolase family 9 protein, partial [Verrucomicrobiota bacterium]
TSNGGGTTPPPTTPTTPPTEPTTPPTTPVTPPTTPPPTSVPVEASAENAIARLPQVGDHSLRILSPTVLELNRITTKEPDPAQPTSWNFVSNGNLNLPATSEFVVTVNGNTVSVASIGFRRRVGYAQLNQRDLRIDNSLVLELSSSIPAGATVEVKNPSTAHWPTTFSFKSAATATRFTPAIHINQEGYVPGFAKKAMIGYYLGSKGELEVNAGAGFFLIDARTGSVVHSGGLASRKETGYVYSPLPYQKVLEADFTSFTTPGEYQIVIPGYGASLPFLINEGIAMNFTRTYAQGLYHQRCGADCKMPFTRHTHETCHTSQAEIPSPQSAYSFTYTTIASRNGDAKDEPRHTAPRIVDEASLLYPFVNKGKIDVSLGHHDAGDYSKYMTNSAPLAHLLMFTAENIAGAKNLDNLGLPESGDGISDLMQEAKHEADYISKMQDADGGFYFLVYPKNRSYESDVSPDKGDTQVVWPKNTAGSAAATAVLAQLGSSPMFKAAYPAAAADYLAKAQKGWTFLANAVAKYGKDGSYQKLTHYGHNFLHDDEIAWAAAELFLATGDDQYHRALKEWFPNPSDPSTFRWGWWRMCESYGNAIRSYAFAARSGRIDASKLDAGYLAKCEEQIKAAGDDAVKWSNQSAYANSFPEATKHVMGAGWFFSLDQAADAAVAFQLNPKTEYTNALVGNMNYEGGANPVNVPYLTGIGVKRQREIVHQWANTDTRGLPMNGIPQGNVQASYDMLWHYSASGNELSKLSFPSDNTGGATYPFYDRWADTWNVTTEFVVVNQARGLMAVVALATQTNAKNTAWKPTSAATITAPSGVAAVGVPVTLSLNANGLDLTGARILWEARDQQPDFGSTYTISPKNSGDQWVDAEITWPDGRRAYATGSFRANAALVNWVDDLLPLGAQATGSEPWSWVSSPTAKLGGLAHQSKIAAGLHEHAFQYALVPLEISAGDTMFVWVHLDPANMPEQIMLSWNDGTWEHRAFWGADKIGYGNLGTASRYRAGDLPAGGQWVKLEVPASAVGLEGSKINGMSFSTFGGRVTWDATGKTSPVN